MSALTGALEAPQFTGINLPHQLLNFETPHRQLHQRQVPQTISACFFLTLVPSGLRNKVRRELASREFVRGCWWISLENLPMLSHVNDFDSFTVGHHVDFYTTLLTLRSRAPSRNPLVNTFT